MVVESPGRRHGGLQASSGHGAEERSLGRVFASVASFSSPDFRLVKYGCWLGVFTNNHWGYLYWCWGVNIGVPLFILIGGIYQQAFINIGTPNWWYGNRMSSTDGYLIFNWWVFETEKNTCFWGMSLDNWKILDHWNWESQSDIWRRLCGISISVMNRK